jgi:trk system potassium uptake protein
VYVIVIGGGKVGYYLTKHLMDRTHEVTLIEKDARRAEQLTAQLGEVVMTGDGDEMSFLATTGMERADVVVAVTGDDEDNLVACQLAKRKFNVPKTVARVNNPANVRIFQKLGVDVALSATEVLLDLIERELAGREPPRPEPPRAEPARR